MNRLHTSARDAAPEVTLAHAKAWARRARIVSVERLDCLGVPVFVSRREGALTDGFTFGKGRVAIESEIGAYMEAIEHHFAEPGNADIETRPGTARDLAEFAPPPEHGGEPPLLARAQDVESGAPAWIPAELVFDPAPEGCARIFGTTSNGLASGNSVMEASLHALFELIERDIWSIEFVRNASVRVEGLPPEIRAIEAAAAREGLTLVVRHVPNDFAMPFFACFLFDPARPERRFFNGGWGCHLDKHIALMRAVTEAAQSRAAYLHGGRAAPEDGDADAVRAQMETVSRGSAVAFAALQELDAGGAIHEQWARTVAALRRVVDRPIYRVVYTPDEGPLHVVRLVVPLLEHFSHETMRVGPRLQAELESSAEEAA